MYKFVESRDPAFVASSLANASFENSRLALLAIYDTGSKLV
jgi:hypothetical protein